MNNLDQAIKEQIIKKRGLAEQAWITYYKMRFDRITKMEITKMEIARIEHEESEEYFLENYNYNLNSKYNK